MNNQESENVLERTIKLLVLCLVLLVWSVIGLLVWIPLLLRGVAVYSFSILPLTLSGNKAALNRVAMALNVATSFYVNGFKLARNAMNSEVIQESTEENNEQPVSLTKTIKELLISIAFWLLFALSWGWRPSLSMFFIKDFETRFKLEFLFKLSITAALILGVIAGACRLYFYIKDKKLW